MKILWVKTDFLHPTTRGGQIRTLETVKRLHVRHELHYVAFDDRAQPEGPRRAMEYCARFVAIPHAVAAKSLASPTFLAQLSLGLVSRLPVAVARWRSREMHEAIARLDRAERYDAIVCDFLFVAPNIPDLSRAVLFQHNVEAQIWRRRAEHARGLTRRAYFGLQAARMAAMEGATCRRVKRVIAVSQADADLMRAHYGVTDVQSVDTGVDADRFAPPAGGAPSKADLVFVGSMDWMPNVDGVQWFAREVLPLIRQRRPGTTLAIVGRDPSGDILALRGDGVTVTGTVPDVRPWLWGSSVSIVPLRIGGGTRLKIYEAMAAGSPVLSTTVGAEGLDVTDGETIAIADTAGAFADRCLALLHDADVRAAMSARARARVLERHSWDSVTSQFERLLA